jgi:hypothetical protein
VRRLRVAVCALKFLYLVASGRLSDSPRSVLSPSRKVCFFPVGLRVRSVPRRTAASSLVGCRFPFSASCDERWCVAPDDGRSARAKRSWSLRRAAQLRAARTQLQAPNHSITALRMHSPE